MTDLCNLRLCLNSSAVPRVLRVACTHPPSPSAPQ